MFRQLKQKLLVLIAKNKFRIKFRTKLLISYFVFIFIPVGLVTWISYSNIAKTNTKQIRYSSNQVLNQTSDLLNYKIENIIYSSNQIFFGNDLNRTLKRDENLPLSPQLIGDYNNVRAIVSNIFKKNDMFMLTLFLKSSIYYSNEESGLSTNVESSFSSISSISNKNWYKKLEKFSGQVMWLPPSSFIQSDKTTVHIVSCVRLIKDTDNYTENIGVLKIDLLQSQINDIVKKANITANTIAFILNSSGDIISSSNEKLASKYKSNIMNMSNLSGSEAAWNISKIGNSTAVVGKIKIKNTDWELVTIIPYNDIISASIHIRNEMLILILVIGSLIYVLAIIFSDSLTKRIHSLTGRMKNIQSGNLPAIMEVEGSDEISILIQSYNFMIEQMNRFSVMQYRLGKDVKNAELKALQAQINPHFLYNTLELINWTALRKNVPEISDIVQALAKFYKLSLGKGRDIISLEDELSHIETYVKLQNFRFKDKISLVFDIDEDLKDYCILKLVMQPIVENSILHGILEKKKQFGSIFITGILKDESILLNIKDDGIGMTQEQTATLLDFDYNDMKIGHGHGYGYGIKNVNHRIKLYYGEEYGLSCNSILDQGTTITIHIAAIKYSDQTQDSADIPRVFEKS